MKGDEISKKLSAAARLLSKPGAWGRGAFARTKRGGPEVDILAPEAKCFCIEGAVLRSFGVDGYHALPNGVLARLNEAVGGGDAAHWNDSPKASQAKAVAALRKAARL